MVRSVARATLRADYSTAFERRHTNGVIHRDLKPENMLLDSPAPYAALKLADFGFAKRVGTAGTARTPCGTIGCAAWPRTALSCRCLLYTSPSPRDS